MSRRSIPGPTVDLAITAFLAEPLPSPTDGVRRICRAALDTDVDVATPIDDPLAPEPRPHHSEFTYAGHRFSIDYFDQPSKDPIAVVEHRSWLKFAWINAPEVPEFHALFTPLARLAAATCVFGAVALYQPYWERFTPVTAATAGDLSSEQPLRAFGIVHTKLGCLVRDANRWKSAFPTRWGPVEVDAFGGDHGPAVDATDRMREIAERKLRGYRARLLISLLYRPCRIVLDDSGEVSVEFRNWLTGTRSHFVSERDVAI